MSPKDKYPSVNSRATEARVPDCDHHNNLTYLCITEGNYMDT
jgi:hypothetical protein